MIEGPLPPRTTASGAAERALREAIVRGKLVAGERLPPERELADRFGISRLTLRNALATLAAAGLISVRHGSGYTVRDLRETGGADLLPELFRRAAAQRDRKDLVAAATELLRLRRHLAGAVLEAIAEHPPAAAARKVVTRAVERFAAAAASGAGEEMIVEADLGVVRALLDATDSMVLRVCLNPIIAVLRKNAALRAAVYAEPSTNLLGWQALAAWIEKPQAASVGLLVEALAHHDRATIARLRTRKDR